MSFLAALRSSFAARFCLLLLLLLLPWPGLGHLYATIFSHVANGAFDGAWGDGAVVLQFAPAPDDPTGAVDLWDVIVTGRTKSNFVQTVFQGRRAGYVPCAVFLALALGIRLEQPRRRLFLLVSGLTILQIGPLLTILTFFSGKLPVQAFHPPLPMRWAMEIGYRAIVAAPAMTYAFPALVWIGLVWLIAPDSL